MGIWGGLMGPRIENVEKPLVLPLLFEGSRAACGRQEQERPGEPERFWGPKMRFLIKHALCLYLKMCFSLQRGTHFHKKHETMSPKNEKCCPNHVGYIKISPQWGRMHQDVIKIASDTSLKLSTEATWGDKRGKERIPERWNRKSSSKWIRSDCFLRSK